ncbi:MAG TPA: DsbA family protein, partial [Solirubrobacteraceae bacterium]
PVTLLVFGDYQCPYTRIAERVARRLLGVYGPSLRVAFRNLPLTEIHPRALAAAAMAEAAGAPERFWVLHDTLFDHQDALEDDDLRAYAAAAGVDPAAADWGAIAARLQDDVRSAEASGAAGTPTLFVNGRLHVDGYKQPVLAAALERAGATVADR